VGVPGGECAGPFTFSWIGADGRDRLTGKLEEFYLRPHPDNGKVVQLATGKTKPSDITLGDLRNMRSLVNKGALNGTKGKYYVDSTFEVFLPSLKTAQEPNLYQRAAGRERDFRRLPGHLDGCTAAVFDGGASGQAVRGVWDAGVLVAGVSTGTRAWTSLTRCSSRMTSLG
jgi:hypothetical protein